MPFVPCVPSGSGCPGSELTLPPTGPTIGPPGNDHHDWPDRTSSVHLADLGDDRTVLTDLQDGSYLIAQRDAVEHGGIAYPERHDHGTHVARDLLVVEDHSRAIRRHAGYLTPHIVAVGSRLGCARGDGKPCQNGGGDTWMHSHAATLVRRERVVKLRRNRLGSKLPCLWGGIGHDVFEQR